MAFLKVALILLALFAFHLLMLWMERRVWVYWTKRSRAAGKAAVGPIFDLFQPTRHSTVEEKKSENLRRPVIPDDRERDKN